MADFYSYIGEIIEFQAEELEALTCDHEFVKDWIDGEGDYSDYAVSVCNKCGNSEDAVQKVFNYYNLDNEI